VFVVLHAASFSHCLAAVLGGHSLELYCPDSRVNIRAQFFAIRVIDVWNRLLRLPPHIVTADTVASFVKGRLARCTLF